MDRSTDRRVRRTRALLHRALIELMIERGYARITVQDIIDRADVGRSTFYSHFRDKDDLLVVSSTEYLRAAVADAAPGNDALLAPARIVLNLAAANPRIYRPLVGARSSAVLVRAVPVMFADIMSRHLAPRLDMPDDEFADTVAFLSWGLVGFIVAVIDPAHPTPPETAYRRFESLVGPGLATRLRL